MVTVEINAGICNFNTKIVATSEDMQNVKLNIVSGCKDIRALADEITMVDGFNEVFAKIGSSNIYNVAKKYCKHSACPVPMAIIKAIECECGLALPKEVHMKIIKE